MGSQAAKPHLEVGTAYRPTRPYNVPSSNSNTVLSIVKKAHLSRVEPAIGKEVAHPSVGPLHLPGCFQIDRPRVPEFSVAIVSAG